MNDPREYNVSLQREQRAILPSALFNWRSLAILVCAALLALLAVYRSNDTSPLIWSLVGIPAWILMVFHLAYDTDFAVRVVRPKLYMRFARITISDRQLLARLVKLRDAYLQAIEDGLRMNKRRSSPDWMRTASSIDQLANSACQLIIRMDDSKRRFVSMPDDHKLSFEIERMWSIMQTSCDPDERKRTEITLDEMERRKAFLHNYSTGMTMAETALDKIVSAFGAVAMGDVRPLDSAISRDQMAHEAYDYLEAVCYGDYAVSYPIG